MVFSERYGVKFHHSVLFYSAVSFKNFCNTVSYICFIITLRTKTHD